MVMILPRSVTAPRAHGEVDWAGEEACWSESTWQPGQLSCFPAPNELAAICKAQGNRDWKEE